MKKMLISLLVVCSGLQALAASSEQKDLSEAKTLLCVSPGLGNFALVKMKSKAPKYISSRSNPIEIIEQSSSEVTYRLLATGREYTLAFASALEWHEDVDGRLYPVLVGEFINGDLRSPIKCTIQD
ncbi:MAG: hypothetical protein OM95_03525 [Bdellovibrio sp. ArHS]|uniref:hypothetical protein n=1 Tax=Bdellovibrio sp. ArHS TaxID=1569284 RepID=UPI000583A9FA|nr:hypothetical protein [Bdellovibrio sp. ArHS]KHD89446.1 MAG: hypothetical protein OM95_03525 [Bdellovibrio sp. ArHS]